MSAKIADRHCPHCGHHSAHDLMVDCGAEVAYCRECRRVHLTDSARELAAVSALAVALSAFARHSLIARDRLAAGINYL